MKRIYLPLASALGATVLVAQFVGAQAPSLDTERSVAESNFYSVVEMDCMAVRVKLSKIHENDSLMRVNTGQAYGMITSRLMSRLHAKIVEQRLDGGELVKKTAEFESQLGEFRSHYQEYEAALSELLKKDCGSQQQLFYAMLREVRAKRDVVYEDTKQLEKCIHEYKELFLEFKEQYLAEETENE